MRKILLLFVCLIAAGIGRVNAQIIVAPTASATYTTAYTNGATNDNIYMFCTPNASGAAVTGSLTANMGVPNSTYTWTIYDPTNNTYNPYTVQSGVSASTITGLASGGYHVTVKNSVGTVIGCDLVWVWVNQTTASVAAITPGCSPFTLNGTASAVSNFTYYNPPPEPFLVSNTTTITVCFNATHTYVSDLGFYLVGPATCGSPTIPLSPNPGSIGQPGVCNGGDNVSNLCFTTTPAGNMNECTAATPLSGNYSSYGASSTPINWAPLYGCDAAEGGWKVQIYDCIGADVGALTGATISFSGNGGCGASTITYNSGAINSAINDNACSAATASIYTVPSTPPTTPIVLNNTITYQWTASPAYAIPNATTSLTPSINPCPTVDTWFYLTVTDNKGCVKKDSAFFDYQPSTTPVITPAGPFCSNSAATTLTANVSGGTWSGNGITNAATGAFNPALATIGANTITYTTPGPCGASTTATVTVNAVPTATVPASATYCSGALVPATAFSTTPAGGTFSWTNSNTNIGLGANGTGNIAAFTATNSTAAAISGTIAVTPTLNGCVGPAASYTITVNPLPSLNPVASQTVCANTATTAVTFTSNPTGATVNWSNSNAAIGAAASGTTSVPSFTGINAGSSSVAGIFSATPTLNTCVGSPITFTITVDPLPTINAVTSQTVCANGNTTAINFVTNPAGAIVGWTNSNTSIGMTSPGSGNIPSFTGLNSGSTPVTGNFTAIATLNSCIGPPTNFSITVDPLPVVTPVTSQTVCATTNTAAITFTSTPAGATFAWTNDNTAIGIGAGSTGNIPSFTGTNSTTSPITGNFTVTPTLNTCQGPAASFSIVVSPSPTLTGTPDQTVCEGLATAAVNFNPVPSIANINWTNGTPGIGLAATGSGNIPSFTAQNGTGATVTAMIIATPSVGVCIGPADTFNIVVDPTPVLNAISSQTICETTSSTAVTFTTNPAGATVNWVNSNSAIGAAPNGTGTIPAFTGLNGSAASITGTFTATPVLGLCTGADQTFTITVDPTPTLAAIPDQNICAGLASAAVNFSPTPSIGVVNWVNANTGIGLAANGTGNIPSFTATNTVGATIYDSIIATPSIGVCAGPSQTFHITVYPGVVVNPISNITVCNVDPVPASTFASTPAGATYTWTNSNTSIGLGASGSGNYASFTASNINATAATATVSVTPTLNGCLGPVLNYTITVNPTPAPPTVAPVTYCLNDIAVPLTATPSSGGTLNWWGTVIAGGTSSPTAPTPSTSTATTTNYYVSQVVNNCESPRAQIQVLVNPLPAITAPANITVCAGIAIGAQNFTSTPAGATIGWTNSNTTIGLAGSGIGSIPGFTGTNTTSSVQTGTVTVIPTLTGCVGAPVTYTININPIPTVAVSNVTVCNNASVPATAWVSVPAGSTYNWTNSNTTIGLAASGSGNIASFIALNPGSGPVTSVVNVTPSLNACIGPVATYTITVNATPVAPATTNVTYCVNDAAVALIATPSAGGALNWYGTNASGPSSATAPVPPTTSAATTTYYVSQTISNCEGPKGTLIVKVNPLPVAVLSPPVSGCEPLKTDLTVTSSPAGVSYDWDLGNGTFSGNDTIKNYIYDIPGVYGIDVTVTDVNNCTATTSFPIWVTVFTRPVANFYAQPQPASILDPVVEFISMSTGSGITGYEWHFGDPLNSQSILSGPSFDYSSAGVGTFMAELIVTNTNGCKDTITKPVVIEDDFALYVPSAFSPNGDGINDNFGAKWTGVDEKQYQFWVFDRWGNQVFFTDDPFKSWDGPVLGKGGDNVQEDTYVWKIRCKTIKGDRKQFVGHVTVVR